MFDQVAVAPEGGWNQAVHLSRKYSPIAEIVIPCKHGRRDIPVSLVAK